MNPVPAVCDFCESSTCVCRAPIDFVPVTTPEQTLSKYDRALDRIGTEVARMIASKKVPDLPADDGSFAIYVVRNACDEGMSSSDPREALLRIAALAARCLAEIEQAN